MEGRKIARCTQHPEKIAKTCNLLRTSCTLITQKTLSIMFFLNLLNLNLIDLERTSTSFVKGVKVKLNDMEEPAKPPPTVLRHEQSTMTTITTTPCPIGSTVHNIQYPTYFPLHNEQKSRAINSQLVCSDFRCVSLSLSLSLSRYRSHN